jgi:uncharacterized membrane protein YeaQ/YmgE (transglycosylase-associated protein family)
MSTRTTVAVGLALMVLGVIGALWSSTELTSGFAEIPQHWWSTLATLPLILGAIVLVLGLSRRARTP